jgi:lipoate-protein ligase A
VLGSSQPDDHVDWDRAGRDGVEVCRRRTGGGLVHLVPGDHCWIDLVIPASSRLWHADVGLAFGWVGAAWARALGRLLPPGHRIEVHHGPLQHREAGQVLCFAGLGSGEVTVDGVKVVGLSQRRWRTGARFQCAAIWRWRPEELSAYLGPAATGANSPCPAPATLAVGLPPLSPSPPPPAPAPAPAHSSPAVALPAHHAVVAAMVAELPQP